MILQKCIISIHKKKIFRKSFIVLFSFLFLFNLTACTENKISEQKVVLDDLFSWEINDFAYTGIVGLNVPVPCDEAIMVRPCLIADTETAQLANEKIRFPGVRTLYFYLIENRYISAYADGTTSGIYNDASYLYDLETDTLIDPLDYLQSRGVNLDALLAETDMRADEYAQSDSVYHAETSIRDGMYALRIVDDMTAILYFAITVTGDPMVYDPNPCPFHEQISFTLN